MIGATVSDPELSGVDDYFIRVYPSFKNRAQSFAKFIYEHHSNLNRIAIIYDEDNLAYSKAYSKILTDEFQVLGGTITDEVGFSSAIQPDFSPLLTKIEKSKPEGLVIVASDIDTALIAQRVRLMDNKISMSTSTWAQTETLIINGGQAVEGMIIEQSYDLTRQSSTFIDFKAGYKARFGNEASFGAAYSYEAALVLAEALKKTNGNKKGLKEALLQTHDFNGLMDTFSLDKFGDVERPWYVSTIKDGKFIMVDRLNPISSEVSK
jgi:branched-chain amino acid transport system substrate-binding protein